MKFAYVCFTLVCVAAFGFGNRLLAQGITVQQPVVQVFSVDTVVSVPDRGSAYLGGVSTAAEGRGTYGLFPLGSSTGLRRTDMGVQAGVYIHDFESMDEYLLSLPAGRERDSWVNPNQRAAAAFEALSTSRVTASTNRRTDGGGFEQFEARSSASGPPQTDDPEVLADFYLAHARDAERRGRDGVAMLCYRMAARHGSEFATAKLDEMAGD